MIEMVVEQKEAGMTFPEIAKNVPHSPSWCAEAYREHKMENQ